MLEARTRRKGVLLVLVSATLWSTAGLFVRLAHLDTWTMVAWRSAFGALALGTTAIVQQRGRLWHRLRGFGLPELVSIAVSVFAGITYVLSLRLTTVANVMTIYAALPFIATGIAYFWLRERVTRRFLVAGSAAMVAIVVMAGAVTTRQDMQGIVAALAMTTGFAFQLVHTKRHPSLDMTLLIAVSAVVCVVVAAPLAQPGIPAPASLLACALYGVLTTGLAYILALEGGRLIASGEAGLISMLDVVLGPLWVWFLFSERPSRVVIVCGFAVLGAVLWYLAGTQASRKRSPVERLAG